jgi:hypothetical protein
MKLPVPADYLAYALKAEALVGTIRLEHRPVGDLLLLSGRLVAFDPAAYPQTDAFSRALPSGSFPVLLSVAHIADDQRVAFASIRFTEQPPTTWQVLEVSDNSDSLGFGVDSGVAGFIDFEARMSMLSEEQTDDSAFYSRMDAEMKKSAVNTWSWLNVSFGQGNLIAFSPGWGDGEYVTYVGLDAKGSVAVVVTDFQVVSEYEQAG